jgi:glutamate dehydrogenase
MEGVDRLVEVTARWYLQHVPGQLGRAIEAHSGPFRAFATAVGEVAPARWLQEREREAWALMDRGVPEGMARSHVLQPFLVHGPNVADVALATGRSFEDVTRAFFLVGEATYLDWLGSRLSEVSTTTRWHRWALQALEEDLRLTRRQVAEKVLGEGDARGPVEQALAAFLERREESMTRLGRFMRGIALEEASDLAALTVAVRQVRALSA